MAFSGINFRATSGYVTDNAADTYSLGEAYPTTRGGKTFGFGSSITSNTRDRSTGVDVRLAGIAFMANSGSPTNFTIDLASGTYKVRLALGDAAAPQVIYCQLKDGATVRATIGPTTTSGPTRWLDATGAELIDSAWPSSNATVTIVVSSGALTVALGGSSGGSGIAAISHVAWELQAASGPTITVQPSNQTVTAGATAAFGVTATSSGGALSYQWQRSINSGGSWSNVSTGTGGTSASYTTAATTVSGGSANNGDQYRCNVTDTNGTTATSAASLTVNAAAPVLISATGTATGNTTGIGSVSTTGADGVIWGKRAASAQTDPGGGLEAANGWTSQAVSASGVQNFTFTGLTTNTAVVANYFHVNAGGLRSPVATSAAFTPPTMASSGTLPAQSGTASSAFTYAGATPESQITVQGVGSSSWNLTNAGGSGLGAINGATGVPSGTLTATPGTYTVTVTKIDSSTAGTNPTGGGAPPQTIVRTFSLTVNASGATAVTLSGPSSGTVGSASTAFTVGANGVISGTVTVTPSDAANGGTFTPTSVNISAGAPTATFTYTPASVGAKSITVTNSGSLTNPGALTYTAGGAATAVTLTGPTVGLAGVASTNFTVGANGAITGTVNVTPSAAGCTFSPTSVNISAGTPTATFTCTPAAVGAKSITLTNNGSLTNPGAYTYQANSALATSLSITLTTDGVTPAANLTGLKVAIYNQPTPDLWAGQVPIYTTGNGVTNASGVYTCNITGLTSLVPGAIAGIAISSSDGTLTQGATQKGYVGPVAVS